MNCSLVVKNILYMFKSAFAHRIEKNKAENLIFKFYILNLVTGFVMAPSEPGSEEEEEMELGLTEGDGAISLAQEEQPEEGE